MVSLFARPNFNLQKINQSFTVDPLYICETLICKLVYLFNVFGEHGRYIGNINHL